MGAIEVLNISELKQRNIPFKTWRECMKKVWEVDPLGGPNCGSEMKIISFIDERLLVRHILEHLNLLQQRIPKGLPLPEDTIVETIVCEGFDDGSEHYGDQDAECIDLAACRTIRAEAKIWVFETRFWLI